MLLGMVWPIVLLMMFVCVMYLGSVAKIVMLLIFLLISVITVRSRYMHAFIWFVGMGFGIVVFAFVYMQH